MNTNSRALLASAFVWIIPFVVSLGFYNQKGELVTSMIVFKITMIVVATVAAIVSFWWYYKAKEVYSYVNLAGIAIITNVLLDMIFLLGLLKMDFGLWATTVLPVYLIMIPLTTYLAERVLGKSSKKH